MENFPPNSKVTRPQAKTEKPKVERVTKSEVTVRKKPLSKRFRETYLGGDARSVWGYVAMDVVVPATKDMVADAATQAVERMLFGDARSRSRSSYSRGGSSGSYQRFGSRPEPRRRDERREDRYAHPKVSGRPRSEDEEIIFETRVEAEEVLGMMYELLSKFGQVSVNDLNDLVGRTGNYTDEKFGWEELEGSGVRRERRGGYSLDLPNPVAL